MTPSDTTTTLSRMSAAFAKRLGPGLLLASLCLVYLGLLALNSTTRSLLFSPDSLVYVDAAQNFAAGHGLSQSSLMMNKPEHMASDSLYAPITLWAPLFPLLVGGAARLGCSAGITALLIPVFFCGVILGCCYRLMRRLYDAETAWLALGCLLWFYPLHFISTYAWSETLGISAVLGAFLMLTAPQALPRMRAIFAAGLLLGVAYATRYALLPALGFGALALLGHKRLSVLLRSWVALAAGFLIPAAPVFLRNAILIGNPLGPPRLPSTLGWIENLYAAAVTCTYGYLDRSLVSPSVQAALFAISAAVLVSVALFRRRVGLLPGVLFGSSRWILPAWTLGYTAFLVIFRSLHHTDPIGPRLMAPALITGLLVSVALLAVSLGLGRRTVRAITLTLVLLAIGSEAWFAFSTPRVRLADRYRYSPRLSWIVKNTTAEDLIVGDTSMEIPVYCGFRHTLCFVPSEMESQHPRYEVLEEFLQRHGGEFQRILIIFRAGFPRDASGESQWRANFGEFITDLVYGRLDAYPDIRPEEHTPSFFIFSVTKPGTPKT